MVRLEKLADLQARRKILEEQVRMFRKEEEDLSAAILEEFVGEGVQSVHAMGRIFYIHSQAWANAGGDTPGAVAALKAAGLDNCLMVGTQRLSALYREFESEEEFWMQYPELKGTVSIEVKTSVRIRGG